MSTTTTETQELRWHEPSETWHWGGQRDGCGVYEEDGVWLGNVIADNDLFMIGKTGEGLGTFEEAKAAAVAEWRRIKISNGTLDE